MPRHETIDIPAHEWVQLTNADVSAIRVITAAGWETLLQATAGATPPAADASGREGAIPLSASGIVVDMAQHFPGVPGANRLWAWCPVATSLSVSHA